MENKNVIQIGVKVNKFSIQKDNLVAENKIPNKKLVAVESNDESNYSKNQKELVNVLMALNEL